MRVRPLGEGWVGVVLLVACVLAVGGVVLTRAGDGPNDEVPAEAGAPSKPMCMPDPSICGYPDVENTGVPRGTPLTPINGTVTLDRPGEVLANALVTGTIVVTAPNVTIRNVKLVATDENYGIQSFGWRYNTSGLVVDHVEIDLNGHMGIKGIAFDNYTARNVFFHNGSDCAHMGGHVTIVDSLCVSGPDANDDAWPDSTGFCDGPDHIDGFQSDGGNDIVIRHNTIRNPCGQTSGILLSTNTADIHNVAIDDNLMAGGGYTVYCGTDEGGIAPGTTYTNNVISKRFFPRGGRWGPTTWCDRVAAASGNTWDGTRVRDLGSPTGAGGTAGRGRLWFKGAKKSTRRALKRELGRRFTRGARRFRMTCRRRSKPVIACGVRWRKVRHGRVTWRYTGKVVITRLSPSTHRYVLRVRARSAACGCIRRVIKGSGRL